MQDAFPTPLRTAGHAHPPAPAATAPASFAFLTEDSDPVYSSVTPSSQRELPRGTLALHGLTHAEQVCVSHE